MVRQIINLQQGEPGASVREAAAVYTQQKVALTTSRRQCHQVLAVVAVER